MEHATDAGARPRSRPARARVLLLAGLIVAVGGAGLACSAGDGSDDVEATRRADGASDGSDLPAGEIQVRLEQVAGVFMEGFEVGLRVETGDGRLITSTLWRDVVAATGRNDLDAYYDSVFTQAVPVGTVHVQAEVNVGNGPGPSVPDLDGDLPCSLTTEVGAGEVVVVEVSFADTTECLEIVDGAATTASTTTTTTVQTTPEGAEASGPGTPTVGSSHYVDVDLECRAFELGGVWVLVEGDPSSWQPPGERHEGGTFTIDAPGHGRFVGDAAGVTTATFRQLTPAEAPDCSPIPRAQP